MTQTETIVYVYSNGKLAAEYSTAAAPANPTTNYTETDMLGSPRVLTDSLGNVVSRRDFLPFGEEISPDGSHRTSSLNYNFGDGIRQKFTGYQRDEETQLDFAEARMYSNGLGRFTAVDPLLASGKSANPQTFNRYLYVVNNPTRYVDRDGKCPKPALSPGQVGICIEAFIAAKKINGIGNGDGRTHSSDSDASARMRVSFILTATADNIHREVTESLITNSTVSIPGTVTTLVPVPTGESTGEIKIGGYTTAAKGTAGFGNGRTTETILDVGLRNGKNGAQATAESAVGSGLSRAAEAIGGVPAAAVKIAEAQVPKGTIDVQARVKLTGSGDKTSVTARARARPFPSATGWAYIGMSDGTVKTVLLFRYDETKPSDLVKPMRRIN
ncbi:MAG: RHS repeat-associated core domain-containing protein [Acidobacteria bacterium]|nr:RHS repeat-associated core domain-containing protein [Acidobacteriota bacterium]